MINYQLKLKLTKYQEQQLESWLPILTSIWNWTIRKIELDAKDNIYYNSKFDFVNLLVNHSEKLGVSSHTMMCTTMTAYNLYQQYIKKKCGKPKFKGQRNKLNSILFPDIIKQPQNNKIQLRVIGKIKYHKQQIPEGNIKCVRIIKKVSGWYAVLTIDTKPKKISIISNNKVGIDPGFKHLLTLSNGDKIEHPREFEINAERLAQAQRGHNKKLAAIINEKIANQRKNRNHKLSRKLVSENELIVFSKDNHKNVAKKFGKSVSSSGHYQLQKMLEYKCRTDGRQYIEVDCKFSTMTCSTCNARTGPTGWEGLKVRNWECTECGTLHDRDINAAINTLNSGLGISHENTVKTEIQKTSNEWGNI
ncbi:MAG TPA: RNA-guided endonuclease TnpB family protein [Aquella sp.]|nr:RNA-guided endonuclease TnpB family protein [Aquella sp.]